MKTNVFVWSVLTRGAAALLPAALLLMPQPVLGEVSLATSRIDYSSNPGTTGSLGPAPIPLEGESGSSVADYDPALHFMFEASASAHVSTGFGPPTVEAHANFYDNASGYAFARASGQVNFSFALQRVGPPAPWEPRLLPVTFLAHGEGHASSDPVTSEPNTFLHVQAQLYVDSFPVEDFAAAGRFACAFDSRVLLWLAETTEDSPEYAGYVYAQAGVQSRASYWVDWTTDPDYPTVFNNPGGGSADAYVDPELYLDQAAFDAMYGSASFPLDQYYSIEFSENLIPEPASFWLVAAALPLFLSLRRSLRNDLLEQKEKTVVPVSETPAPTTSSS